jgi:hypothetical protein
MLLTERYRASIVTLKNRIDRGEFGEIVHIGMRKPHHEKSWTWGDCRIFVTGTKGMAKIRLEGDPLVTADELLLKVTDEEKLAQTALDSVSASVTEDFLNRIAGRAPYISTYDILRASEATIRADLAVSIITK